MIEFSLIEVLRDFGFPVFMVLWFIIRTEKVINNNSRILEEVLKKL